MNLISITSDDALRWTENFAAGSFGDPLFALGLAPLLGESCPAAVKVYTLRVIGCRSAVTVSM